MDNIVNVKDCHWKYLRETNKKYFDPNKNTPLNEYLEYIFKGYTFVYNERIPKEIIQLRNADAEIKRYQPDARCEELNLIVEFDGVAHYQDPQVVYQDHKRDLYMIHDLHYHVVRIPYWIQLSRPVIDHLFRCVNFAISLEDDEKMCELPFSFYDPEKNDPCVSISVSAMCEPGRDRFIEEVSTLPADIQLQIYEDIYTCCKHVDDHYDLWCPDYVIPAYVVKKWGIEDCSEEAERLEQLLFNRPFSYTSYAVGGLSMFDIEYDKCIHLCIDEQLPFCNAPYTPPNFGEVVFNLLHELRHHANVAYIEIHGVALDPRRDDYGLYITGFDVVYKDETHSCDTSMLIEFLDEYSELIQHHIETHDDILIVNAWW